MRYGKNKKEAIEKLRLTLLGEEKLKRLRDKDWLINQYINLNRTLTSISKEIGVSIPTVVSYLNKIDIKSKGNSGFNTNIEQRKLISQRTKVGMKKPGVVDRLREIGNKNKTKEKRQEMSILQKSIHEERPDIREKQRLLAIERWKNIEYRDKVTNSIRESRIDYVPWNKGLPPQKQPGWRGGINCEPYCDSWLDLDYKKSIKERDNYKCQNPNCSGNYKRLSIHHIDYNKKNCFPNNLITLCNPCNSKANQNREFWCSFYKNILEEKEI